MVNPLPFLKRPISWAGFVAILAAFMLALPVLADLRSPAWWSSGPVPSAWHYRVAINIPAGSGVNATIKQDVDFNQLLSQLGVAGTFDINSPRVVRANGSLSTVQEFTDRIYAGATDAGGNARGEVRFLLEDAGAVTYFLYFDITQNGSKAANPQTPINGNFERGAVGTTAPLGWSLTTSTAGINAEMRGSEFVSVASNPTSLDTPATRSTDGTPLTGDFSYLLGNRSAAGGGVASNPGVVLSKSFTVPASAAAAGSITVRWRPEGWDSGNFDFIRIELVNGAGAVLQEIVGPTAGNYGTKPFGPNNGANVVTNAQSGYRQYNGFDCNLLNAHMLVPPMTVACHSEPWFTATQSLAAWAGQTISVRIRFFSDAADKSWFHLDDIEWSVIAATLGTPEGFGVNITQPAAGALFAPGQTISISAQVDAQPTASTTPVTASLFTPAGALLSGPHTLFNDGTQGDLVAGDAIWTNNAVPLAAATALGTGYVIRVSGRDASTSLIGAQNGLVRGPGTGAATAIQANFWNIDEIAVDVATAAVNVSKSSSLLSDPVNGTSNPKHIPGATLRYCVTISNAGPMTATTVTGVDMLPSAVVVAPGTIKSGPTCATATTTGGASLSGATLTINVGTLAPGSSLAVVYDAVIQ